MKASFMHLLAALAAMCLWAGAASAQSNLKLRVNVPFSFVAEGTTFSSGEYEVTQLNETVLVLRNLADHSSAVEKTAGAEEAQAWAWLNEAIRAHYAGKAAGSPSRM